MNNKTCLTCGQSINQYRSCNTKYCSSACYPRKAQKRSIQHHINPNYQMKSKATVGSVSEYVVAINLLQRGFEVFKSLSPTCSCDIICMKNGNLKKIEVKTGYKKHDDTITLGEGNMANLIRSGKFDILAIVTGLDEIRYVPEIE